MLAVTRLIKLDNVFTDGVLEAAAKGWFMSDRRDKKNGDTVPFYDEHGLDQQPRRLRVLQPSQPALRRRLLPQHQRDRRFGGGDTAGLGARQPRECGRPGHPVFAHQLDQQRQRRHRRTALPRR